MLIIKAKNNLPREKMKNIYRNLPEQMQLGLIFVDDSYEIEVVEPSTKWIPVSERLPEIQQDVLLSLRSLDVRVGFRSETEPYFYCNGNYIEAQNVLAWMPLPNPYKIESEEIE